MKPANEKWQKARQQAAAGLNVAGKEAAATAQECAAAAQRLLAFGRGTIDARRLAQEAQTATQLLGERLYAAGRGEASLRKQIEELADRRKSVEAAKGPTRLLEAERRGLFIRLAEPCLEQQPPPELAAEQARVVLLRAELESLSQRRSEQQTHLLPDGNSSRLRVAAGCAVLVLVAYLGARAMFGGGAQAVVVQPGAPGEGVTVPPVVPPKEKEKEEEKEKAEEKEKEKKKEVEKPKSPVVKEHWAEEDAYFPRRLVKATYVNDTPHGECKCFDASNRLIAVEQYRDGVSHGKRISYYPSGKKFCELEFQNGKAVKASTTWFENGQIADVTEFDQGVLHGKVTCYFEDGNLFLESENVNGVAQGTRLHFLPNGVCFGTSEWSNGQKVGQQIQLDVNQSQFRKIDARSRFSLSLKDHWRN